MPEKTIQIEGLADLQRAFRVANVALARGVNEALDAAADPVRFTAQQFAVERIRRVGVPWSRMRVGVRGSVAYVAPVERGIKSRTLHGRRRPRFKALLLDRAMIPALEANRERVIQEFDDAMHDMAKAWARV